MPQESRQQGNRRVGGQVGPDGAEVDHQEDAGPEARARRQSEKAGEHGLAAIQGVAHHLQVVAALEQDAHGGDPHQHPAVLGRQGGTGQPLPSSDGQSHHEQARSQEPAQIEAVGGRNGKRVHSPGRHFPGRDAEVGGGIRAGSVAVCLVGHLPPWRRRVTLFPEAGHLNLSRLRRRGSTDQQPAFSIRYLAAGSADIRSNARTLPRPGFLSNGGVRLPIPARALARHVGAPLVWTPSSVQSGARRDQTQGVEGDSLFFLAALWFTFSIVARLTPGMDS